MDKYILEYGLMWFEYKMRFLNTVGVSCSRLSQTWLTMTLIVIVIWWSVSGLSVIDLPHLGFSFMFVCVCFIFFTCHLCVAEVTRSVLLLKLHTGRHLGYIEGSFMMIYDANKNQLSMKKVKKINHIWVPYAIICSCTHLHTPENLCQLSPIQRRLPPPPPLLPPWLVVVPIHSEERRCTASGGRWFYGSGCSSVVTICWGWLFHCWPALR